MSNNIHHINLSIHADSLETAIQLLRESADILPSENSNDLESGSGHFYNSCSHGHVSGVYTHPADLKFKGELDSPDLPEVEIPDDEEIPDDDEDDDDEAIENAINRLKSQLQALFPDLEIKLERLI